MVFHNTEATETLSWPEKLFFFFFLQTAVLTSVREQEIDVEFEAVCGSKYYSLLLKKKSLHMLVGYPFKLQPATWPKYFGQTSFFVLHLSGYNKGLSW